MQQVMAELQQLGAIDPAAQEKLMADLRQTDSRLWPMVLQQFRAATAYRRKTEPPEEGGSREKPTSGGEIARMAPPISGSGMGTPNGSSPDGGAGDGPSASEQGPAPSARPAKSPLGDPRPPRLLAESVRSADSRRTGERTETDLQRGVENGGATAPREGKDAASSQPRREGAATLASEAPTRTDPALKGNATERPPAVRDAQVLRTSYSAAAGADWQTSLAAAIQELESQAKGAPQNDAEIAQHARLRMLYLLAGRREDAMRPIPSAPPAMQDFWSQQLFGLATWLDAERTPDTARRAAEAKRILGDALARLGETAPLVVRGLAFCTAVHSYGSMTPFKKCEFVPDQELLLYAEVENFASEPTPKGCHTSLRSSYQIFDSRGQRVAEHEFATIEEYCQNPRRDFFIGYHLRLPKRIYPGKHKLQLTVEDLKSRKVGQSTIELVVKGEE